MKQSRHNSGRQVTKELNIAKFCSFSVLSVMCAFTRLVSMGRWDYTGEQETVQQDDEEDYNFLNSIIFESRFMKFVLLFVKKLYYLPKKIPKFSKKLT